MASDRSRPISSDSHHDDPKPAEGSGSPALSSAALTPGDWRALEATSSKNGDFLTRYVDQHFDKGNPLTIVGTDASNPTDLSIFVNLSANVDVHGSALDKSADIEKLAALTKGKSVKLIVQTSLSDAPGSDQNDPSTFGANTDVVRYEIENGQKHLLYAGPSSGLAQDVHNLLTSDPAAMQANHLMLINESHGDSLVGLSGDAGRASVDQFNQAVRSALDESGRQKLDVLDFDACSMATDSVVQKENGIADYLVASELPEIGTPQRDSHGERFYSAQPTVDQLRGIIENLPYGAQALANSLVESTAGVCTKDAADGLPCGAEQLSILRPERSPDFTRDLDTLGASLMKAESIGGNSEMLKSLVKQIEPTYSTVSVGSVSEQLYATNQRDLGTFLTSLEGSLKDGSLRDTKGGDISKAIASLRADNADLVAASFENGLTGKTAPAYLGFPAKPLDGMSVYLPESDNATYDRTAESMKRSVDRSIQDAYLAAREAINNGSASSAALNNAVSSARTQIGQLILGGSADGDWETVQAALKSLEPLASAPQLAGSGEDKAANLQNLDAIMGNIKQATARLDADQHLWTNTARMQVEGELQYEFATENTAQAGDWLAFVDNLRNQ